MPAKVLYPKLNIISYVSNINSDIPKNNYEQIRIVLNLCFQVLMGFNSIYPLPYKGFNKMFISPPALMEVGKSCGLIFKKKNSGR